MPSESFLKTLFDEINEAFVVFDDNGHIKLLNPAFTKLTGYTKEEMNENGGFLKGGMLGASFYEELWGELREKGHWRGELWDEDKGGGIFPKTLAVTRVDKELYAGIFFDLSKVLESEDQLRHLAYYDSLTGLPNRTLFRERLNQSILYASRNTSTLGIIMLDLDNFKYINDTLGHTAGDELLKKAASRLHSCIRKSDTAARLSGDEFGFIITNLNSPDHINKVANNIISCLSNPFRVHDTDIIVTASLGVTLYPEDGDSSESLMRKTDSAVYHAKSEGRNNFQFFSKHMSERSKERLEVESGLRKALMENEFILYYQPKIDIKTGSMASAEVLVRWENPDLGIVSPGRFIPVAEETGLIVGIGDWVLKTACEQSIIWQEQGFEPIKVSVNASARQFMDRKFYWHIHNTLTETGLPPELLEIEVTESTLAQNIDLTIETLRLISDLGVTIALDDFGTGYSSLSYLKRMPIETLKIDREFVKNIPGDSENEAIAEAVMAMGKSLQMRVVAEGVETAEQLRFLMERGCSEVQGYFFSKPLPISHFTELLRYGRDFSCMIQP